MTSSRLSILLVSATAVLAACVSPERAADDSSREAGPRWQLVWADEFDGPTIDASSWRAEVMPDPFNEELQYYTDRLDDAPGANAWIEEGRLVIEARREIYEHRRHTSARLTTQGKREFFGGRFEARLRLPEAVGTWPAFWLLGSNLAEVGWPACGEIDVMEGKGRLSNWTSGALHSGSDPEHHRIVSASTLLPRGDFQGEWHLFAVEWRPDRLDWFVDGARFWSVVRPDDEDPTLWPFDHGHPFFLVLNLAVGGWFDAPHGPPEDLPPQRFEIDFVRVYRESVSP